MDGVSFAVERGRTLGLVGESGCGKTTTARAVLRLVPVQGGRVELDGIDLLATDGAELRRLRRRMQMVFQDPLASLDPRRSVGALLREPLDIHGIGTGVERSARVFELLDLVGLSRRTVDRYPHQFSGGQRQRVGIARALALHPDLVVADEPISALDVSIQAQVTNLLQELQERLGLSYLYIAHDLAVVRHISHDVAVMYLGQIVERADTSSVFESPSHPYTIALLSAVPVPDPDIEAGRKRIILPGDAPSAARPPSGCRFHPRCWLRRDLGDPERCAAEPPGLLPVIDGRGGHVVACHFAAEAVASETRASVLGRPASERGRTLVTAPADPPPAADQATTGQVL